MIERIQGWWQWYASSDMGSASLAIPMVETTLLFAVLTVCLLFRFSRIGLIVAYVFVYRWGWAARQQIFPDNPDITSLFTFSYIIFGVLVFAFSVVWLIRGKDASE